MARLLSHCGGLGPRSTWHIASPLGHRAGWRKSSLQPKAQASLMRSGQGVGPSTLAPAVGVSIATVVSAVHTSLCAWTAFSKCLVENKGKHAVWELATLRPCQ